MNLYDVITLQDGRIGTIVDILSKTVFAVELDDYSVETVRADDIQHRRNRCALDVKNQTPWYLIRGEELLFVPDDYDHGDDLQNDLEHDDYNDGGKRRWPRSFTERTL